MTERTLLSPETIAAALEELPGWSLGDGMLRRTVIAPTFPAAVAFVDRVAVIAEDLDHHPDIDIRWTSVHLAAVTHSAGGVTGLDVELARRVEQVVAAGL